MENEKNRIDIPTDTNNLAEKNEIVPEEPVWRLRDFKGFLHAHSWEGSSCGRDTIDQIREATAQKTGLEYLGFSEHVGWPEGEYWLEKIKKEFETIDQVNSEGRKPYLFKGIEVSVMPDGKIDGPDELMDDSDIVVGSIHYDSTDRPEQRTAASTVERWCKMMDDYPSVNILGHPLRDLDEEEWPKMDWDKLCSKASEKNLIIELAVSDHITREMPTDFLLALRKHDNLVSASADFHSLRVYLTEEGDLNDDQQTTLKEFSKIKNEIANISFGDEEKNDQTMESLRVLKTKHDEIEDSEELNKIYEILLANVKYLEDEEGNLSAEKRPLSYKMLRRYAKRINQLRKPISEKNSAPIISPQHIINLWNLEKIENWINSRKQEIKIRGEL